MPGSDDDCNSSLVDGKIVPTSNIFFETLFKKVEFWNCLIISKLNFMNIYLFIISFAFTTNDASWVTKDPNTMKLSQRNKAQIL